MLAVVRRRYGSAATVVAEQPLSGGYVSAEVRRIELDVAGEPVVLVLKRTNSREVAALRALAAVPGLRGPELIAAGGSGAGPSAGDRGLPPGDPPPDDRRPPGDPPPGDRRPPGDPPPGDRRPPGGPPPGDRRQWTSDRADRGSLSSRDDHADPNRPGEQWLLMPSYPGSPPAQGAAVPVEVYDALARVHTWFLGRPPSGLLRVDPVFWRRLCLQVALPAVRAAAAAAAHPGYEAARRALPALAADTGILRALVLLPTTLAHGDMHRGNVLATPDRATIIDWGNARIAPGGLDLAVLAAQDNTSDGSTSEGERHYHRRVAELTGHSADPRLQEVARHWAVATTHVQYLAFAADHLGGERVGEMVERAAHAVRQLGPALDRLP